MRISKSNAKHCQSGLKYESQDSLISAEELCANKREIKFEYGQAKRKYEHNLTPVQKLILQAARTNNVVYIKQMAEVHFAREFNFVDHKNRTPLYIAVENKNVEAVRELLRIGADVNMKCVDGNTCLHRMMICQDEDPRNEKIINILLNNGQFTRKQLVTHQKFHKKTKTPYTMLMLKNRANIKAVNKMNKTALYYASQKRTKDFGWQQEVCNVIDYE